jgi:hypothetical protein
MLCAAPSTRRTWNPSPGESPVSYWIWLMSVCVCPPGLVIRMRNWPTLSCASVIATPERFAAVDSPDTGMASTSQSSSVVESGRPEGGVYVPSVGLP